MVQTSFSDPLTEVLPEAADRLSWRCATRVVASDTGETVFEYEHIAMGRSLRLDAHLRVYGQDPQGVVRLFGRGGALALAVALNAVYDGHDDYRPTRIILPGQEETPNTA